MGNMLIVLEVDGATASDDQDLVTSLAKFVIDHKSTPQKVKVTAVHASYIRAEATRGEPPQ